MRTWLRLRTLIVALLIATQPASAVYAAGALGTRAPCPVHAALAQPKSVDSVAHHHHGATHEAVKTDGENSQPSESSFNCCAGHLVGVCMSIASLAAMEWVVVKSDAAALEPATADLASSDPPPRLIL